MTKDIKTQLFTTSRSNIHYFFPARAVCGGTPPAFKKFLCFAQRFSQFSPIFEVPMPSFDLFAPPLFFFLH